MSKQKLAQKPDSNSLGFASNIDATTHKIARATALARRATIPVIGDAPGVRAFTVETLRALGYDVPESRHALSASSVPRLHNVLDGQDSSRHVN